METCPSEKLAVDKLEAKDWDLDEQIANRLSQLLLVAGQAPTEESSRADVSAKDLPIQEDLKNHLLDLNPHLFVGWDFSTSIFKQIDPSAIAHDLEMASAVDDLLETCALTPPPKMTREALQIFTFRLWQMQSQGQLTTLGPEPCKRVDVTLHPDAITYRLWEARVFFSHAP